MNDGSPRPDDRTPVDVLIPTYRRRGALAMTLTALCAQTHRPLRVVISDQTDDDGVEAHPEVLAALRILRAQGIEVDVRTHLPRRGMAEQRQFLLDCCRAPYALYLDDDVVIEADLVARMVRAIATARCGFVGSAVIGLSYADDVRPHQQAIEWWDGDVQPEAVRPNTPAWARHHLHSAANLYHVQRALGLTAATQRLYKVAWVGGCVLYDAARLREAGGFRFWRELPDVHCGEEVLAQTRLMARFGGAGLIPSGAYHLELPTTLPDRRVDAPRMLGLDDAMPPARRGATP
jgi:glycosyltransferase involved in cell wall biosynthesis